MSTFRYFISFYKPYKKVFFIDLLCAIVISLIDISFPLILSWCVGSMFSQSASDILMFLPKLFVGLLLMYVIRSLCRYYVTAQGHIMGASMERDMRQQLFDQYLDLSFSYYDQNNTGQMMSKIVSDLFDIAELAHHGPENIFISSIKLIGSFSIMMYLNVKLASALLVVTLAMLIFSKTQNQKMRDTFMDNRKKIGDINSALQDSLGAIRVVQSFTNEEEEHEKFLASNNRFLKSKEANYHAMGSYYSGNHFFQGILYIVILVLGGYLIATGQLQAIQLSTFALYVNVFVSPLEILIEFTEMFQKGFSGFKRFEEVMKEVPDIQNPVNPIECKDVQGKIEFDHVSFHYGNENEKILEDMNLIVEKGQNVALVGPSGGGKTTLCSLIPRFYDVTKGSVRIDDIDVRDYDLKSLRSNIGLVSQDIYMFDGTILDNIRYGKMDATMQEIEEAARQANIADFIESLPEGYNTYVGERGTRLSGGQKQRISIARAFLKNPKILILDEATSALDNQSERIVQNSLQKLAKNRTCITIAHRLSTIRNADEILVLDESGLKERGSHDELMKKGGLYASYYNMQFEGMHIEMN
jgi:ATP-binding cassette subfamily B protein